MAAIDPLLGVVQLKKADGLSLTSDEIPALLIGGTRSPLTMPPLAGALLDVFIEELLSPVERAALARGEDVETTYTSAALGALALKARRVGDKTKLSLKRGPTRPAARPASEPVVAAAVAPPPPHESPAAASGQENPTIEAAFAEAHARRASDLFLTAGGRPALRIEGTLSEVAGPPLSQDGLAAFFAPLLTDSKRHALAETGSADLSYHQAGARFRVNVFRQQRGLAAAVRPVRDDVPTLEVLGLPARLLALTEVRNGLVLVTGATGAGKSTTLAALLEHVNRTRACHVVTLEDPVEYVYPRRRALVHQREVGSDVPSFAAGLRAALRESPDIILIGELRDADTIRMALTAAETGHLVLSTLHSGNPMMAVERLVDAFGDGEKSDVRQQLGTTLRHIVTQQLVPAREGVRIPVLEVLTVNAAVAAQIREGRTHMLATQMELGADDGMVSIERALYTLCRQGRITREAALAAAARRDVLESLLASGVR